MKTYKKGTLIIKRYKKGMEIKVFENLGFSSQIAFDEEEIKILKEYFKEGNEKY